MARSRASGDKAGTDQAEQGPADKSRPTKAVLAAWIAGGVTVVAAVVVALVLYLTGGSGTLAPAPDEASAILPTRIAGLSVELDKNPRVLQNVPFQRDAAAIVVTDPKRGGAGGYAAAVVVEAQAMRGDFATSFEDGLRSDGKVGEFSDTVVDAVSLRTAQVEGNPDVSRVWWYRPYRDAVVVVYASDETTGRRIVEGLVQHN